MSDVNDALIERVAEAIFKADNEPDADWIEHTREWEQDEYRNLARAAIKAMIEEAIERAIKEGKLPT